MADSPTARETIELFLRTVTEGTRDDLADLYAEDVVVTNKFAPGGVPSVVRGNAALRAGMTARADILAFDSVEDVVLHETTDPEVVIAEFAISGHLIKDDSPFRLTFVNVMRVVDGLITESRDHADALAAQELMARIQDA